MSRSYTCPKCGGPISRKDALACRACLRAAFPARFCADCGAQLQNRGRNTTNRCGPCWFAFRTAQHAAKRCSWPGCEREFYARGLCNMHYLNTTTRVPGPQTLAHEVRKWVKSHPCQLCGYSKMPSQPHRIIPANKGGEYVIGNMVALCSRCHEEVHEGLASYPEPLQLPEGMSFRTSRKVTGRKL